MFFPNVFGAYESRELATLRVGSTLPNGTVVTVESIMAEIRRFADFFDAAVQVYENALARRITDAQGTFGTGTAGGEMQPYTELGETEATRTEHNEWAWGAPIRRWRDRQIYTEEYLATADLAQINTDTIAATNRYLTTRLKTMLRALLRNTNYDWVDREFPGEGKGAVIPVKALFNADGNTGRMYVNNAVLSTAAIQHYLPSGQAAMNIANFTIGRSTLRDIGYTGRVVHLISPTDEDAVKALPGFIPLPPAQGDVYARAVPAAPTTTAVVTRPQAIGTFSNGGVSDGEVVVFPFWPAGYTFSYDATKSVPLVIREHANAAFRGFRLVQDQSRTAYGDGDIRNKRWEYIAGAAVENRANGVVVKVTAGAYTVPQI
jgi:hypothetical protein